MRFKRDNTTQVFVFIVFFLIHGMASAQGLRAGGSGSTSAVVRVLAEAFNKANPADAVQVAAALGTPGGIKALNARALDVALASRPLSGDEINKGKLTAVEFARTPFVIAVASTSALSDLTLPALTQLLEKTDATWPDGSHVRLVLRPKDDVDIRIIMSFSPGVEKAMQSALARSGNYVAATDDDAVAAIVRLPGAIGGTTLGQILAEKRPLKALTLAGKTPTVAAIKSGEYPYYKRHFLAIREDASPAVRRFVAFVQSADARRLLDAAGCWSGPFNDNKSSKD